MLVPFASSALLVLALSPQAALGQLDCKLRSNKAPTNYGISDGGRSALQKAIAKGETISRFTSIECTCEDVSAWDSITYC